MVESGKVIEELLTKIESADSPGEQSDTGGSGKARGKKESIKAKEYQKKKQDALEGKDSKSARGSEPDSSKGKGQSESGREDSSDKGSKASGSGSQTQSSLQSAQTTVQFSSGGAAGSFGSLLALFASSATLVRAEVGSVSILSNQTASLNLQNILRTLNNQAGSLVDDLGRNARYIGKVAEQVVENTGKVLSVEAGGGLIAHSYNATQDIFSSLLNSFAIHAAETKGVLIDVTKIPLFSINFKIIFNEGFNANVFFFSEATPFVFPNSLKTATPIIGGDGVQILGADGSPAVVLALSGSNAGIVNTYFSEAGLGKPGSYTYQVISPIAAVDNVPLSQPISQPDGVTVVGKDNLSVNILPAPQVVGTQNFGLTLTSKGDLYTNVLEPMSVLVKINGGKNDLVVRINAGPGTILDHVNYGTDTLVGLRGTGADIFLPTIFKDSGAHKIVGNAQNITLGGIPDNYSFPSSTIFRHVGTSNETVLTQAAYGNFSQLGVAKSTFDLQDGHSYALKLGGNVLDVFGTKYGVGDWLTINLATNPSGPDNITMGGNTLAGFGMAIGDLGTLNVSSFANPHSSTFPTTLTFNGNVLWVDKNIDSTLYPHLQNLLLSNRLTEDSQLNIVFKDSIIHGNLGADTFYGDVEILGDLNNSSRYNAFITGVQVSEVNGHVVTTPPPHQVESTTTDNQGNTTTILKDVPSTNFITWGNNVYDGGADPGHPSSKDINTYHFTLLGNTDLVPEPVMPGHQLITNFNPAVDTLDFQLTPALFRSLDINHDKTITATDLNSGIIRYDQAPGPLFDQVTPIYNPLTYSYISGVTINFKGGGSLSLEGNPTLMDFTDIPNLKTEVYLTYLPVGNLAPSQIFQTPPSPTTPYITSPYIYGQGPGNIVGSYYNELDNFFANSLFAHYTVSGLTDPLTGLSIEGVPIDPYGSITVDSTVPYIIPLTITATTVNPDTNQVDTVVSDPLFFGFLKAPITVAPDGTSLHAPSGTSNILIGGGLNSIIVGAPDDTNTAIVSPGQTSSGATFTYGSNLIINNTIVDNIPGSKIPEAYGNYKTVVLSAKGTADAPGVIGGAVGHGDVFNFKANALYVNGIVFGVATSLTIEALGGNDSVIKFKNNDDGTAKTIDATATFENNMITTGPQVIYGNGIGTLTGIVEDIFLTATPGTPKTDVTNGNNIQSGFDLPDGSKASSFTGTINTSSVIQHNTFNFGSTLITILGDSATQDSTIVGNVENLTITAKDVIPSRSVGPNLVNLSTATFQDNHFIFGDATIISGLGNATIFGHLANFGNIYDFSYYRGFVKGVTVSYGSSHLTITDGQNNSITWGNNTYIAGPGTETYEYAIVEDAGNKLPIMQGFDTIQNFDLLADKIVFNIQRNLFKDLGMTDSDSQQQLAMKLDANSVVTSNTGADMITISFTGPLGSLAPYGQISLTNVNFSGFSGFNLSSFSSLAALQSYHGNIIINSVGADYTPPVLITPLVPFDPVFEISQPLAFLGFISNADSASLIWGSNVLPPEFNVTSDGTLEVFKTSDGKTPVDAFISVTVHDDINPGNIIHLPTLHIFALGTDSLQAIRDSATPGSTATEIFETAQPGNTIIGGGANIIYDDTHPTIATTPLVYGSKLIYDISGGGHTAIGDVESIQFTNTATTITIPTVDPNIHPIAGLDGQIITFGANMFNIKSGNSSVIYGNNKDISLVVHAGNNGGSLLTDATISHNIFNFGPNTIYTVNSTTPGSLVIDGNLKTLTLSITNGSYAVTDTIGDASIKGNEFHFSPNKLFGSSDATTLNPGIGTLIITNTDVSAHDPATSNSTPISGNKFTFGDSILTGGTGPTYFNADIADLTNTAFAGGIVTVGTDVSMPVQVTDSQGNVITWGNDTYKILSGSQASTLSFTLLALGGNNAAMEGNATIEGFRPYYDTLDLKLTYALFRQINTDFDRSITNTDLVDSNFAQFAYDSGANKTTISFASSLAAGSLIFQGQNLPDFNSIGNITTSLAYTPAPITVINLVFNSTPLVFVTDGGNGLGVYGNILDNYFDHIDIGNSGSIYTVTKSAAYPQLINPSVLFNSTDTSGLFDKFGTARPESIGSNGPILSIITAKPKDIHYSTNVVSTDVVVAAFNGTATTDLNADIGGTFSGNNVQPSYLQGKFANETLIGNADQLSTGALNESKFFAGLSYGTDQFGGNLIINTDTGNTAYGIAREILYSVETSTIDFATNITGTFNFSPNALYVNGAVFGIADKFLMNAKNTISGSFSAVSLGTNFVDSYAHLANGFYNFGGQTIFGQGILVGALGLFQINTYGNNAISITGPDSLIINAFTEVRENQFTFAPTEIVVLGSQHSVIFPHINSLSFFLQNGMFTNDPILNQTVNAPAVIEKNKWVFQDSVAVGGSGGVDYYSDINDLSRTSFWSSPTISLGSSNGHIVVVDNPSNGFVNIGNNTISGGNNTLYLSTASGIPDTIHLNVVKDVYGQLSLLENLNVYNFNPADDTILFNLSPALYKTLNGNSTILSGLVTAATLNSDVSVVSNANTTISTNYGSLVLYGVSGHSTLASFPNIQVGTTLVGNPGVSDAFTISIPTIPSNFKEVDHIVQFDPSSDYLRFVLSPAAYNQLGQYGLLNSNAVKSAYLPGVLSAMTVTPVPAEYPLSDPYVGADMDSIIKFVDNGVTSGSITLHNVNITDLNSLLLQVGQQGTAAADTFYFMVPGADFSTFSGSTFITGFNITGSESTKDNIEITVSKALYDTINPSGTASAAAALISSINSLAGGVSASSNGSGTDLLFLNSSGNGAQISLEGVTTTLSGLGSHLHLGYIDYGTTGIVDTFSFKVTGGSFNTFNQFDHLANFIPTEDILQVTVPLGLYNTINPEGALSGGSLYTSLATHATSSVGGIITGTETAHYLASLQNGAGSSDFVFNFEALGGAPSGTITLHNVDGSTTLTSLGTHFQFGSTQAGTSATDTFNFNVPVSAANNFSAFQQFDHITGFEFGRDNIDISLPVNLFNVISAGGTLDSSGIETAIKTSSSTSQGGIDITTTNGSSSLVFVTSSATDIYPHGAITLDGVTVLNNDITSFGDHLRFGSIQQGTSGADTFVYDHAANGSSADLSAFKEFDHLLDFNSSQDTLTIKISEALYTTINNDNFPGSPPFVPPGNGTSSNNQLISALDTGEANGISIGTHINVAHTAAQYGSGVDSILQFMTGSTISGTITIHNLNINNITDIPNLVVTH